jgi:hypothetical protein
LSFALFGGPTTPSEKPALDANRLIVKDPWRIGSELHGPVQQPLHRDPTGGSVIIRSMLKRVRKAAVADVMSFDFMNNK